MHGDNVLSLLWFVMIFHTSLCGPHRTVQIGLRNHLFSRVSLRWHFQHCCSHDYAWWLPVVIQVKPYEIHADAANILLVGINLNGFLRQNQLNTLCWSPLFRKLHAAAPSFSDHCNWCVYGSLAVCHTWRSVELVWVWRDMHHALITTLAFHMSCMHAAQQCHTRLKWQPQRQIQVCVSVSAGETRFLEIYCGSVCCHVS